MSALCRNALDMAIQLRKYDEFQQSAEAAAELAAGPGLECLG